MASSLRSIRSSLPPLSSVTQHNYFSTTPLLFSKYHSQATRSSPSATPPTRIQTRNMTSSSATTFQEILNKRRTIYQLSNKSTISDARVEEIVKNTLLTVPSSFNSQSTRIVILLKEEHVKLWEFTKEILKAIVPAEAFPASEARINGFKAAYGSILFFDDLLAVEAIAKASPAYADRFPGWATESNGMHQYAIWVALEAEGLGANLQHYNPLIDEKVQSTWNVPATWLLKSQLVFGKPEGEAGPKTFKPIEDRLKVYGA